jgi:hypothetical protein
MRAQHVYFVFTFDECTKSEYWLHHPAFDAPHVREQHVVLHCCMPVRQARQDVSGLQTKPQT